MADINELSNNRTPFPLTLLLICIVVLGLSIAAVGVYSFIRGPIRSDVSQLGTQGDFFGGHAAAAFGALTLAIVVYTSYRQLLQQERLFARQFFVQGADLIFTAMREEDPIGALRLIDYYSRLALTKQDGELYLILNAAIYGDVRKTLESDDRNTVSNYPYAVHAINEIGKTLKEQALRRKAVAPQTNR